jgi:hypothetical protein
MGDLWTRRGMITLVAGAGATRLFAFSSDFWNKKDPEDWTHEERDQLTSKSPWAKEVSATSGQSGYPPGGGGGYPGGGGGGGGMGRRGGMSRQPMGQTYKGTVLWESAKPVALASRHDMPKEFADHYVISVNGFPLSSPRRQYSQQPQDDESSNGQASQDMLDRLKQVTYLEPKGRRDAQPGLVRQPVQGTYGSVWFGFDRDFLNLKAEDKEAEFTTQFGQMTIKAKFNLKDMLYRGELAI